LFYVLNNWRWGEGMSETFRGRERPPPDRELAKAIETSKAPAISRAAAVLRLIGESDTPLGVHAIARALGLVPSTCFHVLKALAAENLVSFDPDTKRYALAAGVLALARHWLRRNRFSALAQPSLDRIGQAFGVMVVGLHIADLDQVIVVAMSQAASNIQLATQIGSRFPALSSATGRCIGAFGGHADADLEARFREIVWDDPPTYAQWREQVRETREQGFAVDDGAFTAGLLVVSAPVWDAAGVMRHALVAIGISSALRRAGLAELEAALLAAAQALSGQS
jgi:DNA-binding IclR family transcriptional regulator